ncbi:MAG: TetR/AcrR family transcriptional regulator [Steroidobacteraceae bacterium]|nr:TetR/AcrR family transcriptional regulator [Steroidobacteraceae bacterium]
MGRKARFGRQDIRGAALRLVAERGPGQLTMAAVAAEAGAPTGSIYHRYRSRDELLAELWMEVVERFQHEFVAALGTARDLPSLAAVAGHMPRWAREHPLESRLLLLHRRQDFVSGDWPPEFATRAAALEPQLGQALRRCAAQLGLVGSEAMPRLRYALLDAPFGALKPYIQPGKAIPRVIDQLAEETARAVLAPMFAGTTRGAPA